MLASLFVGLPALLQGHWLHIWLNRYLVLRAGPATRSPLYERAAELDSINNPAAALDLIGLAGWNLLLGQVAHRRVLLRHGKHS